MTKDETDLIIKEQDKSTKEILKVIEQEKCELLGIIQGKDKAIQDLQKENAELKELKKKKEEIEIMTNFCKECKKMHTDQLAQAKEIIKFLINPQLLDKPEYYEWRLKAEQSLNSEVEK